MLAGSVTAAAADIVDGNYMGSGRACYGMLTITAQRITWTTPFSQCRTSSYAVLDRDVGPGGVRVAYQLRNPGTACRYSVLVLTHRAKADMQIGWNVTGFPSLDDTLRDRRDAALGCYLYRY